LLNLDLMKGLTMNDDHIDITPAEEKALVIVANACGLTAPCPPNVWELILTCLRKSPGMRLTSLAFAVADFAPLPASPCKELRLGDVMSQCRKIGQMDCNYN